jgi:hypothetical protein
MVNDISMIPGEIISRTSLSNINAKSNELSPRLRPRNIREDLRRVSGVAPGGSCLKHLPKDQSLPVGSFSVVCATRLPIISRVLLETVLLYYVGSVGGHPWTP